MTSELFTHKQQTAMASERSRLVALLENDPTPKERVSAIKRVADIDPKTMMYGYLSRTIYVHPSRMLR